MGLLKIIFYHNNMTKTPREIEDTLQKVYHNHITVETACDIVNTLLEEARQEAHEEIKKKLIAKIPIALRKHSHVWTIGSIQDTIVDSISSL